MEKLVPLTESMLTTNQKREIIMKKNLNIAIVLLAVVLFSSACSPANTTNNPSSTESKTAAASAKEQIVYGLADKMNGNFHPLIAINGIDQDINRFLFPSLLQTDADDNLIPYFAESYNISEDGLTMTFNLHQNAVWPNGDSVTAHDVYFTFKSLAHPDFTGSKYNTVSNIVGAEAFHNGETDIIEGIHILDDYTIEISFDQVYAPALSNIGRTGIIPEYIWGEIPPAQWQEETELLNHPVSFGAYHVVKYETEQYLELEANEQFFSSKPLTQKIIIKYIKPDSIMAEFANKTIDIAPVKSLRQVEVDALIDEFNLKFTKLNQASYRYIGINLRKEIFQDINLRKALVHAIDRESITKSLLEGRAAIIDAPFMPSSWANPSGLESYTYDLELAKKYLEEGGYQDTDGDGILESPDGIPLKFTYKIVNDPVIQQVAILYQDSLKQIGIEIEIIQNETNVVANEAIYNHDFDLYTLGCLIYLDSDISGWWHTNRISNEVGTASWNFDAYSNETVDECLDAALATFDKETRKQKYQTAAEQINKDIPMIFLFIQDTEMVYGSNIENYEPLTFDPYNNIENWVIYE
jgi:peptide/nickel transport system substrate-binding protein